jgi:Cu/Ag efflux pump CusA
VPIEGSDQRLGEVANVIEDHQPLIGDAHAGGAAQLLLVIEKLPEANTVEVSRDVDAALAAMGAGLGGIEIDSTLYRPAGFVESAIGTYGLAALVAALLVAGAVALLLRGWRTAVATLVAVALSVVGATVVLWALGSTMNAVVIAGMVAALAVLIDDAVVGASELSRPGATAAGGRRAVIDSLARTTAAVRGPLLYATVIAALMIVPVLVLEGALGAFVQPFAIAYLAAILASLLVAVTVTPVLTLLLRAKPRGAMRSGIARTMEGGYEMRTVRLMLHPMRAIAVLGVIILVGLATVPVLSTSLIPQFRERDLLIEVASAPGTSRPEINRIVAQATRELESLPGVEDVGAHVGRAVMSDAVVGMDAAKIWVNVDPAADYDAIVASIGQVIAGYPGLDLRLGSYLSDRAATVLPSGDQTVALRLFGPDLAVLQQEAAKVRDAISSVPGVQEATVEQEIIEPQIEVEVDIGAATEHGLKPGDVRRQAATLLSGLEVGNLFEDQKIFEVVVWGVPDIRHSLSSIRELRIDTPTGDQVRLADVAQVGITSTPSTIRRQGISRRIEISALVEGRDRDAVAADIHTLVSGMAMPREYHAEVAADASAPDLRPAAVAAIAALIGILLVLQAALGSWRLAALSLVLLPAAASGGLVATVLAGGVVSLGTIVGLVAVAAIAVRNELSLAGQIRRLEAEDQGPEAIVRGARERFQPTLVSSIAVALAMLPLLVLGGRPGLELVAPIAVAVVGGLISASLLTLFVVPALYYGIRPTTGFEAVDQAGPIAEPQVAGVR